MMTAPILLPGLADPAPKGFRRGTHRTIAPAETVERVRPFLSAMGITRVANITGLDHIGIPVVVVCRPNSRSLAVSQGKGLDLAAARASGLMESVETHHAERIDLPLKLATYEEMRASYRVAEAARLPRTTRSVFHPALPLLWIEGHDLLQQEPVWVPYEMVHTNYTLAVRNGREAFLMSSNGLASGNHLVEALSHALCEVVERDSDTLWTLLSGEARLATRLDLSTVDDLDCQEVLGKYERAGVEAAVWDITSDIGVPAFRCTIRETARDALRPLPAAGGIGCHASRKVALLRALTEAAQSRLTMIAGSRDDVFRDEYDAQKDPAVATLNLLMTSAVGQQRDYRAVPTFEGETLEDDVAWVLERLQAVGIDQVVMLDLTKPEYGLPVVRVVVPGLEGPGSLKPYYAYGARAAAVALGGQPTPGLEGAL